MAHRIPLDFLALRLDAPPGPPAFEVEGGAHTVVVRGRLSAGSTGWQLSANASRHRRRITLHVLAQRRAGLPGGVEDHAYVATLRDVPPGRYRVRLQHVFSAPELGGLREGLSPAELTVQVDGPEAGAEPASGGPEA